MRAEGSSEGEREFSRRQVLAGGTAVSVGGLFWLKAGKVRAQEAAGAPLKPRRKPPTKSLRSPRSTVRATSRNT